MTQLDPREERDHRWEVAKAQGLTWDEFLVLDAANQAASQPTISTSASSRRLPSMSAWTSDAETYGDDPDDVPTSSKSPETTRWVGRPLGTGQKRKRIYSTRPAAVKARQYAQNLTADPAAMSNKAMKDAAKNAASRARKKRKEEPDFKLLGPEDQKKELDRVAEIARVKNTEVYKAKLKVKLRDHDLKDIIGGLLQAKADINSSSATTPSGSGSDGQWSDPLLLSDQPDGSLIEMQIDQCETLSEFLLWLAEQLADSRELDDEDTIGVKDMKNDDFDDPLSLMETTTGDELSIELDAEEANEQFDLITKRVRDEYGVRRLQEEANEYLAWTVFRNHWRQALDKLCGSLALITAAGAWDQDPVEGLGVSSRWVDVFWTQYCDDIQASDETIDAGPDITLWNADVPLWRSWTPCRAFGDPPQVRSLLSCILQLSNDRFSLPGPAEWWSLAATEPEIDKFWDVEPTVPRERYSRALAGLLQHLPPRFWYECLFDENSDNALMWAPKPHKKQ